MKPFPVIAGLVLLAGCKTFVSTSIYLSDLPKMLKAGTPTAAQLTLELEMPSMDTCNEQTDAVVAAYETNFSHAEFVKCSDDSDENLMTLLVETLVIPFTDTPPLPDQAIAIGITQQDDVIAALFLANNDAAREIWDALPEDLTSGADYDPDTRLSAQLVNDNADEATLSIGTAFVDDVAVIGPETRSLAPRSDITLKFSDVADAAFSKLGHPVEIVRVLNQH